MALRIVVDRSLSCESIGVAGVVVDGLDIALRAAMTGVEPDNSAGIPVYHDKEVTVVDGIIGLHPQ